MPPGSSTQLALSLSSLPGQHDYSPAPYYLRLLDDDVISGAEFVPVCIIYLEVGVISRGLKAGVSSRDDRFGSKVGQIGPKWDKSGAFSDQISMHLARGR